MAAFLGHYLFNKPLQIVSNKIDLNGSQPVLNYSPEVLAIPSYQIEPCRLLFESGIQTQQIQVNKRKELLPFFFATAGQHAFDLPAAIFYLITRYEEYLPHEKDVYGRYAHTNSLAFKNQFLNRPLVDEWMLDLKIKLQATFAGIGFHSHTFKFTPTYDVDMAWSYRNKGFMRNAAGFLKNILKKQWPLVNERIQTLWGKKPDPFAVFEDLDVLHKTYQLTPVIFFLLAQKIMGYDKNISPSNKAYKILIQQLAARYKTGIHLSWQASQQTALMESEKFLLENIQQRETTANRMHYINFHLPQTFQQLQAIKISEEYSMGYGSINGFRASICIPFKWYDLANETSTSLTQFPFCYMEANSIFEQKDNTETALKELQDFHDIVKKVDGVLVTIFHNHLIGFNAEGRRWWHMYEQFLQRNF